MANRRMFSKSITSSSRFLMMSQSAQNLYFHLGMNADDDGFCEHFTVMRMTESKPDDLGVLQAKGFVKLFDDKVLIITEWKENNYIQKDRYTPSKYLEIYKQELKLLADGQPMVNQMATKCIQDVYKTDTQVRLGKVRLGKESKNTPPEKPEKKKPEKLIYGEFQKVKLTAEEFLKLVDRMGEQNTKILIDELDAYIASKGKRYSSHYATILTWARRKTQELRSVKPKMI